MPTTKSDLKALGGKFLIFSRPGLWRLSCVDRDQEWRLEKRPDLHPGNLLHLLNHAAGHRMSPEEKKEAQAEQDEKVREKVREKVPKVNAVLNQWMRSQL